jgi:L-ribulose-5-phosphate 4-epimerase
VAALSRLDDLKAAVLAANRALPRDGLVTQTWGNVSAVDRESGLVAIKPSGVAYDELTLDSVSVLTLGGEPLAGLAPSSDAPTHLAIYRAFPGAGAVVHTHSRWATAWAQAERPIPALGTTHADHFGGAIPCTRRLSGPEIAGDYEEATGAAIVEAFAGLDPARVPGVLVARHGPFAWGPTAAEAVENARVLEEVAALALHTIALGGTEPIDAALLDRHFVRKHGPGAYYGQPEEPRARPPAPAG